MPRAAWTPRLLPVPDGNQKVGFSNERFANQNIRCLEISSVSRKRNYLVSSRQGLLEMVELFAKREILAVLAGLEWQQGSHEIAGRACADRCNLIGTRRKCCVKSQLGRGRAAESGFGLLYSQSRIT